jgi:hypothetical protein
MDVKLLSPKALVGALVLISSTAAHAAGPAIAFDFGRMIECRDVTPPDSAEVFPHEKIIEMRLRLSVHLLSGDSRAIEEVRVEIGDVDSRMRVHSFEPTTRLASQHTKDIRRSTTTEQSKSLGASLGGEAPIPVGGAVAHVTPTINGGLSKSTAVTETEYRVPPQEVVVASGTIGAEHGVFFKLRSTPQTSLEGTHDLVVRFIVTDSWRGDSVQVCCQATGQEKFLWMTQQATLAHTCGPVALYMAGDLKARQAAQRYVAGKALVGESR